MKKKKLITKLSLGKTNVSNLENVHGGKMPPYECTEDFSGCNDNNYTRYCGNQTNNCTGQTCGNCITNAHPLSDPLHCRTCHTGC